MIKIKIDNKAPEINTHSDGLKIYRRFMKRLEILKNEVNIIKMEEIPKDIKKSIKKKCYII